MIASPRNGKWSLDVEYVYLDPGLSPRSHDKLDTRDDDVVCRSASEDADRQFIKDESTTTSIGNRLNQFITRPMDEIDCPCDLSYPTVALGLIGLMVGLNHHWLQDAGTTTMLMVFATVLMVTTMLGISWLGLTTHWWLFDWEEPSQRLIEAVTVFLRAMLIGTGAMPIVRLYQAHWGPKE